MTRVSFLDRIASNGALAGAAAVAIPLATMFVASPANLVSAEGFEGLRIASEQFSQHGMHYLEVAMNMIPEQFSSLMTGAAVLSAVEKLTGRQLTKFSIKEQIKSVGQEFFDEKTQSSRDASQRSHPKQADSRMPAITPDRTPLVAQGRTYLGASSSTQRDALLDYRPGFGRDD